MVIYLYHMHSYYARFRLLKQCQRLLKIGLTYANDRVKKLSNLMQEMIAMIAHFMRTLHSLND